MGVSLDAQATWNDPPVASGFPSPAVRLAVGLYASRRSIALDADGGFVDPVRVASRADR